MQQQCSTHLVMSATSPRALKSSNNPACRWKLRHCRRRGRQLALAPEAKERRPLGERRMNETKDSRGQDTADGGRDVDATRRRRGLGGRDLIGTPIAFRATDAATFLSYPLSAPASARILLRSSVVRAQALVNTRKTARHFQAERNRNAVRSTGQVPYDPS